MLCKMIDKYGGTKDASFPQPEVHDGPEFYVEVLSKGGDASGQTISFKVTNHSAWPARVQDNISFRYYMDLSEVKAAGKNPEDLVIRCDRDQSAMYAAKGYKTAEISKPKQYSGDIYYIEVNLPDGRVVLPISEGQQQCEILLAIVMPDYGSGWDSSNDFSAKDLGKTSKGTDGSAVGVVTPYVPVYVNGKLYYGEEPDGTKADGLGGTGSDTPKVTTTTAPQPNKTTTTTTSTTTTTTTTGSTTTTTVTDQRTTVTTTSNTTTTTDSKPNSGGKNEPVDGVVYGDANCDGTVDMSDVVLIMQSLANPNKYGINGTDKNHLTEDGSTNADVDKNVRGITSNDALFIQEFLLNKRTSLFPNTK
jgi:hypothetical protein